MKIVRKIFNSIQEDLKNNRNIIILYGARQTGKTTLSNDVLSGTSESVLKINADEIKYADVLSSRDLDRMKLLVSGYDILFIDEAQRIPDIGINLKIIHDNWPSLKILATGSSSFDLANKVKEPLTGRTSTHILYPISLSELSVQVNAFELQSKLEEYMIYGMYPVIFHHTSGHSKEKYLRELTSAYLYKDVFELSSIKNNSKISSLLKLLALQIGSETSVNELALNLKLSQETVASYIELLEKAFIIFRLGGYSRNLRKEVSKRNKIYFWDLGVRNCLVENFNSFNIRNDVGALWENFIISERFKYLEYTQNFLSSYFWRTYTGAEIDYIEEKGGKLYAYEIKYKKARKIAPKTWVEQYGDNYKSITRDNFWEFVI
ncbi:MAG: ATP-binding protein [Bacteroidetes bacterium]|nr:ATP-binding protein [Bacteroidota bacterium]